MDMSCSEVARKRSFGMTKHNGSALGAHCSSIGHRKCSGSEMFDAGFDLAHMVGAKFVIRLITGRVFPESWDG